MAQILALYCPPLPQDGTLTFDEFLSIMEEAKKMYPQVSMQLSYVENNIERWVSSAAISPTTLTPPLPPPRQNV